MKSSFPVSFLGNIMEPAELGKNLGVILDADISMQRNLANLCNIIVTTISKNYGGSKEGQKSSQGHNRIVHTYIPEQCSTKHEHPIPHSF